MSEPTVKKFPNIKRSLAPKPRPEPQPGTTQDETIAASPQTPRPLAAVPSPQPTAARTKEEPSPPPRRATGGRQGSKTLSFLIPDDLRAAYKARATRDRQSLPNVLLDAIEATHHDLAAELDAEAPERQPAGLFERPQHREAAGNHSTMVIRVPAQAAEMIDELWQHAEAGNRSQFIRAALRKYLAV